MSLNFRSTALKLLNIHLLPSVKKENSYVVQIFYFLFLPSYIRTQCTMDLYFFLISPIIILEHNVQMLKADVQVIRNKKSV